MVSKVWRISWNQDVKEIIMIGLGLLINLEYYLAVSKTFGQLGDYQQFDVVRDYHFPLEEGKEREELEILPYEGTIVQYLAMKMNCMQYDEQIEVDIKIPENHRKLFKSQFLLEAVNNKYTFYKVIDFMKAMEVPAIINYYGDKYGQEVADKLLKDLDSLVFYMEENPLESYEECIIAKYVWKTVADL